MWDDRVVELCDPRRLTTSPMMMYFLGVIMQALLISSRCAPPPALPGTAANRSPSEWADHVPGGVPYGGRKRCLRSGRMALSRGTGVVSHLPRHWRNPL